MKIHISLAFVIVMLVAMIRYGAFATDAPALSEIVFYVQ
jgi:hypothetical protein